MENSKQKNNETLSVSEQLTNYLLDGVIPDFWPANWAELGEIKPERWCGEE